MNRAAPAAAAFKEAIDLKLLTPVQRNLFTGEEEPIHVDIGHAIPEDKSEVDDGISLIKTEDSAQLILSGFGRFLGKKSERLIESLFRKAPFDMLALKRYWGKPAVRDFRGDNETSASFEARFAPWSYSTLKNAFQSVVCQSRILNLTPSL